MEARSQLQIKPKPSQIKQPSHWSWRVGQPSALLAGPGRAYSATPPMASYTSMASHGLPMASQGLPSMAFPWHPRTSYGILARHPMASYEPLESPSKSPSTSPRMGPKIT